MKMSQKSSLISSFALIILTVIVSSIHAFADAPFLPIPRSCHPFYMSDSANPGKPGMLDSDDIGSDRNFNCKPGMEKNTEICVVAPAIWNDDLSSGIVPFYNNNQS